jgi:Ni,Fe-hydrogenase III large subunit
MMDQVKPGGVADALKPEGAIRIRETVQHVGQRLPGLIELYDSTTSLLDRTAGTGIVRPDLARQFGAPGYVGRASGRNFDAPKALPYPPYDKLEFAVPVLTAGDVDARVWVRIREVEQSLALIGQILDRMPDGPITNRLGTAVDGEGLGVAEGFRGDVLVWVRIDGDHVAHCHLRDPSWFQWPLLEAAIEGKIVADFPLCNKSFNCSYSGHDL